MGKISFLIHRIVMILSTMVPCILLFSCSPKVIYVKGDTEVVYRDSIITKIDSVEVPLPYEVVKEVVPFMDTLFMETSLAVSKSYVDTTTKTLQGEIKNKQKSLSVEIEHKEQFHSRDSIVREPYPVEVEKIVKVYPKWLIIIAILGAVCITAELLLFFMKR